MDKKYSKMVDTWRQINSYNLPLRVILAPRGIGKTFWDKLQAIYKFITQGKRFNYIVETDTMVTTLSQNNGEKFFSRIIQYCQKHKTRKTKIILDALKNKTKVQDGDSYGIKDGEEYQIRQSKIRGGAIFINGETAGYILSLNSFGDLKRNDFIDSHENIIDEFVSERMDIRTLQNPYKMVSLIESITRDEKSIITMTGNTVRLDDPVLVALGISNLKVGEWRKIYRRNGQLFGIAHRVDPREHPKYVKSKQESVSGGFADLMGQTSLNDNEFRNELADDLRIPQPARSSWFFACLHGELGSIRVNQTKDRNTFYIVPDYGDNEKGRFCVEEKYTSPNVYFIKT